MPESNETVVAEAAFIEASGFGDLPDLAAHRGAGSGRVKGPPEAELVLVYLVPDHERYTLEEDGTVATLYIGRRYDAATLKPKGSPKRSNDPGDLRQWWRKATGYTSSSGALAPSSKEDGRP